MLCHGPTLKPGHDPRAPNASLETGGMAFSTDLVHWTAGPAPAYTSLMEYTDGTVRPFARRERPALLLDEKVTSRIALSRILGSRPVSSPSPNPNLRPNPNRTGVPDPPLQRDPKRGRPSTTPDPNTNSDARHDGRARITPAIPTTTAAATVGARSKQLSTARPGPRWRNFRRNFRARGRRS